MNAGRIMAIFEKDMKEFMRNMMLLTTILVPIFLAFMYGRMDTGSEQIPVVLAYLIIGVAFSAILSSGIMTMMAEENEKDTLRALVQSPASMMDILLGKSLVVILMTTISLVISFMLMDTAIVWSVITMVGIVLLGLFFLNIGIAIGLTVNSVATTSVYLLPVMLIFGFTPMVEILVPETDHLVRQIAEYLPIYQNVALHEGEITGPLIVLIIWVLVSFAYVAWAFRKRMKDENK